MSLAVSSSGAGVRIDWPAEADCPLHAELDSLHLRKKLDPIIATICP